MDRMILKIVLVSAILVLASSCATNPQLVAERYERAIAAKSASLIISMQEDSGLMVNQMDKAIQKGNYGQLTHSFQWKDNQTTATITAGSNRYLMINDGEKWKIRCATIGPFHDQNPEMTLLLLLHYIQKYNETEIRKIVSSKLKLQNEPFSEEFKAKLAEFSEKISPKSCEQFNVQDNMAYLSYDSDKTLTLIKENEGWRILDLW